VPIVATRASLFSTTKGADKLGLQLLGEKSSRRGGDRPGGGGPAAIGTRLVRCGGIGLRVQHPDESAAKGGCKVAPQSAFSRSVYSMPASWPIFEWPPAARHHGDEAERSIAA